MRAAIGGGTASMQCLARRSQLSPRTRTSSLSCATAICGAPLKAEVAMHPPQPQQPPADVGPHGRTQQRDRPTVLTSPTAGEQHGATLERLRARGHAELTTERGDPILAGSDPMG